MLRAVWLLLAFCLGVSEIHAQPYGVPDTGAPGDAMIQRYMEREAARLSAAWDRDIESRESWEKNRVRYLEEYFYMLGLSPLPEKTPLKPTITGTLHLDGFDVDRIHFQSRPGLYVTGNLYRPPNIKPGERLPAIFYVCGHSGRGRNGNKVAYQSHGIWFARHGYICLMVDTLQLGEIAAFHHGTYNLNRWWWHSAGYTPAGVEAWNGIRGLDYLLSRDDVDPDRIGVTGISGGGAATFWIAAADPRVKVAVPVSGMADLESYVPNRVINGHCDCMFLYNTFDWPWTRIAGLIAPRPLFFVNSDQDSIFPMDANERVINRLERLYSLYQSSDRVDAFVSVGGHAYREDIRKAVYRFFNTYMKNDPREVSDSEVDIVSEGSRPGGYPIPPESLRVFPTDADLPHDELNTKIDEQFVAKGSDSQPVRGQYSSWKDKLRTELRRVSFGYFPETIPPARKLGGSGANVLRLESEEGIEVRLHIAKGSLATRDVPIVLVVLNAEEAGNVPSWIESAGVSNATLVLSETRGIGSTAWTRKNPPNYVERSHVLLGRTVDTGRVWDVLASAKYLLSASKSRIQLAGRGSAGLIAAYAAALDDGVITGVTLVAPASSHTAAEAPQFLNVLRVCDVPDAVGLIAPRPLRIVQGSREAFGRTIRCYEAADAAAALSFE